jgi:hypothetical protein
MVLYYNKRNSNRKFFTPMPPLNSCHFNPLNGHVTEGG